jgi:hypothetical protein
MSIGMLLLVSGALCASFAESYALSLYRRAVRGSRERYLWRSRYIALAGLVAALSVAIAIADVMDGDTFFAALWLAIAAMRVVVLILNRDKDDDDWFKRTGRRIRGGLRRLAAALRPSPGAAAPVPA